MLIWAGSFVFIKIGLEEIKPYNLAFYRFLIASPLLLAFVIFKRKLKMFDSSDFFKITILALTGVTLLYAVQFVALTYTTAINSSILINTCVIYIAVMSIFLGEKVSNLKIAGIIMSFFGVVMVVSKDYSFDFFTSKTIIGDVLMLFDGLLWAIYTIAGKSMLEKYSPDVLTVYVFVIGSVLLLPFALYEGIVNPFNLSFNSWISLIYLSLLCSVVAYVIWYSALTSMETTEVAAFVYLVPLFTAIMAFYVLKEEIGVLIAIGGFLTMLGIYMAERY
jgi:drug/metabolite transporter (DMT)-like permease